jgi:hypothetical protein
MMNRITSDPAFPGPYVFRVTVIPSSARDPRTYDVIDFPSIGFEDMGHNLPVGTRIRFEKTIWMASDNILIRDGSPVAYGTILDPPFESHRVNLVCVSEYTGNRRAQPDPEFLSETPP